MLGGNLFVRVERKLLDLIIFRTNAIIKYMLEAYYFSRTEKIGQMMYWRKAMP